MRKHSLYACLIFTFLLCACSPGNSDDPPIQAIPPYSVTGTSEYPGINTISTCPSLPSTPPRDLQFESIYDKEDPHRADVDQTKKKAYKRATRPIYKFENGLISMSNSYLKSGGRDETSSACALDWLYQWAKAGALLGNVNAQGTFIRQWDLAVVSSAYIEIRASPYLNSDKKLIVEKWLNTIANVIISNYENSNTAVSKQNNHLYWAAWAVTATGVATDNNRFYRWGVNQIRNTVETHIAPDGTLPLELNRGKKALQYHIFALSPLVMVAETAERNGENIYDLNDRALHRLISRVSASMKDPSWFESRTGYKQSPASKMDPEHFSWVEVYNNRFPDPGRTAWLKQHRPVFSRRTGGDMTYLMGHI